MARWLAVAAVLCIVFGIGLALWSSRRPGLAPQPAQATAAELLSGQVLVGGAATGEMREGALIQVQGQQSAVLRLADASRMTLAPGAAAVLHGRQEGLRQVVELREGEGRFEVSRADRQFAVATPVGRVLVVGTEFRVHVYSLAWRGDKAGKTLVAVASGVVEVQIRGKAFRLAAGQQRLFAPDGD